MSLRYKKIDIPDSLARAIRARCLASVGQYDHGSHKFVRPRFDPSRGDFEWIQATIENYQIDSDEVKGIVNVVLSQTTTDAKETSIRTLPLNGDNAIKPGQHFRIVEGGDNTDLVYFGNNEFYVIDTTRPTLLPGDIIIARDTLVAGSIWHFDILRDEKPFIDDVFVRQGTAACFITKPIDDIVEFQEPEIFQIIDESDSICPRYNSFPFGKGSLLNLADDIQETINDLEPDYFDNNDRYPYYNEFLSKAKSTGISTYLLNLLCQRIEKNEPHQYVFVKADWEEQMTEKEKRERRDRERRAKIREQENLEREFQEALDTIKVRRILFGLFEKDGQAMDPDEVENLISKLETSLKDPDLTGHCKIQTPRSDYQVALDKCKANKIRNIINGAIVGAVVAAIIFIAVTWVQTKANKAVFDENLVQVESYIQQTEFEKADSLFTLSRENFRPSYMKPFVISGTVKTTRKQLDDEIDKYVTATIGNVTKMKKANRGRIDKYSWELVKRALDLRPQNDTLQQFRDQYIKQ